MLTPLLLGGKDGSRVGTVGGEGKSSDKDLGYNMDEDSDTDETVETLEMDRARLTALRVVRGMSLVDAVEVELGVVTDSVADAAISRGGTVNRSEYSEYAVAEGCKKDESKDISPTSGVGTDRIDGVACKMDESYDKSVSLLHGRGG